MISRQRLERYRRMTPEERFAETVVLMASAWEALLLLPPAERARRIAIAQRGPWAGRTRRRRKPR